ncbi:MAG: hypothetical protein Q4F43_09895 [Eubacteriales bacterium]|nr:hypothetical protein [Eubacteriales bacterium]
MRKGGGLTTEDAGRAGHDLVSGAASAGCAKSGELAAEDAGCAKAAS